MELHLVSSSSFAGLPANCDITFSIPNFIQDLPDWRLWNKDITPLRDRVMIEKLFSIPKAQGDLHRMMESINKELRQCAPNNEVESCAEMMRPVVCVGITCQEGTRVSPCYVEKLYEEYKHGSLVSDLTVTREHCHPIHKANEPSKDTDFIWQLTALPINYLHGLHDLTNQRMWTSFPFHLLKAIEAEFRRDPFNNKLELSHSGSRGKYVLNFETGEVYSAHEKKTYRLRCTTSTVTSSITCNLLSGHTYKGLAKHYGAAGILFYSVQPITGEPVFLLGHMTYGCESWCDFGGLKKFRESARQTAARESSEETLEVLGDSQCLVSMLENYETNNAFKVVNQNTAYISHILRVEHKDYPSLFKREALNTDDTLEVDEIRWFSLTSLREAIKMFAIQQSRHSVHPIFANGEIDDVTLCALRYEFLQTLCIAEKLKFLHYIQHICAQLHRTQCASSRVNDTGTCSSVPDSGANLRANPEELSTRIERKSCQGHIPKSCEVVEEGMKSLKLQAPEVAGGNSKGHNMEAFPTDSSSVAVVVGGVGEKAGERPQYTEQFEREMVRERTDRQTCKSQILYYGMGTGKLM